MNLDITIQIPMQRVYDVIVNALDNNSSGYWADFKAFVLPKDFDTDALDWLDAADRKSAKECRTIYFAFLVEGGYADVKERDSSKRKQRITLAEVKRGLALMAKVCPGAFADLCSEDDDVWTADALMQCIVLHDQIAKRGELIYG